MAIKTTAVNIYPLRGMDQRWIARPNKAELIEDMSWTSQDAWRQAGGLERLTQDFLSKDILADELTDPENSVSIFITPTASVGTTNVPGRATSTEVKEEDGGDVVSNISRPIGLFSHDKTSVTVATVTDSVLSTERTAGLSDNSRVYNGYVRHQVPYSLHWFSQFNGAIQWLVYETTSGGLYYFYGSRAPVTPWRKIYHIDGRPYDGSARQRTHIEGEWTGSHFQTFSGRVYILNGYDEPIVFDGRHASRAGYSAYPPDPSARTIGLGNEDITNDNFGLGYEPSSADPSIKGTYRYRVSFLNSRGQESPMSTSFGEITFSNPTDSRKAVTVSIPQGPKGTVARRVYRTQNMRDSLGVLREKAYGDEYYYLQEIQDNITLSFVDVKRDIALGSLNSEKNYGLWPSSFNRVAAFKNTMFLANSTESLIRFSAPRQPEELPEDNVIDLGDSNSGPIVAMYQTKNALIVFKNRGIYLIKGDPLNGFFAETLTLDTGCIASKSLKEIPGLGLAFLGIDGVYLLEGAFENTGTITAITRLGQPIEAEFKKFNTSMAENARACLNTRDREYWLCIPINGEIHPSLLFKFHYEVGEWSLSRNFKIHDFVTSGDHRSYVHIASSETTNSYKGLYVYSRAFTSKGAATVAPLYRTVHLSPNSLYSAFNIIRVQALVIGYGDNDLKLNFKTNRELSKAYVADLQRDQKRPLEDLSAPKYDATTWDGTSTWWHHRPVPIRFDVSSMHKGPVQEIQFDFSPASSRIQLLGYEIEVRIGSRREVLTLTAAFGGTETR